MKKFFLVALVFALAGVGIWFSMKEKGKPGPQQADSKIEGSSPDKVTETAPATATATLPGVKPGATITPTKTPTVSTSPAEVKDGVDGNIAQPGDDGDVPPPPPPSKVARIPTLAGVKDPKVWLVASDLRALPNARAASTNFEVGYAERKKMTPWKNRSGTRFGDAVQVRESTTGTFVRGLSTGTGTYDAVALCAPGAKECLGTLPTQLKVGLNINHKDHWLAGPDRGNPSSRGGSSFTALFVAARGSKNGNPLLEHQNGESAGSKGVFLGWVGPDLVGSIHGLQGVVGVSAVKTPNGYTNGVNPQIYSLRFDRKKGDLKLFSLGENKSAAVGLTLPANDAPDNDQYFGIALGSKNPGAGAITYVFEQAVYSRALDDKEICAVHQEWNRKYGLKIPSAQLKPCVD